MAPNPAAVPRVSQRLGRWLPPKQLGNNLKSTTAVRFYCNGQTTQVVNGLPSSARVYKRYSLYHESAEIWSVPFDASTEKVGDGVDDSAAHGSARNDEDDEDGDEEDSDSDEESEPDNVDWSPLTFTTLQQQSSYIGLGLPLQHLPIRRHPQHWPEQILPDTYRVTRAALNEERYDGLVGELPLLIGLMCFALPPALVPTSLPACIHRPWRVYGPQQIARGAGCKFHDATKPNHVLTTQQGCPGGA